MICAYSADRSSRCTTAQIARAESSAGNCESRSVGPITTCERFARRIRTSSNEPDGSTALVVAASRHVRNITVCAGEAGAFGSSIQLMIGASIRSFRQNALANPKFSQALRRRPRLPRAGGDAPLTS
jgi:hypothetical protein